MPIPLYPPIVAENNLAPDHGGSRVDELCEEIHGATKGWGANKQKVIDALATQDATTRTYLAIRYKELYEIELSELMKKEFRFVTIFCVFVDDCLFCRTRVSFLLTLALLFFLFLYPLFVD